MRNEDSSCSLVEDAKAAKVHGRYSRSFIYSLDVLFFRSFLLLLFRFISASLRCPCIILIGETRANTANGNEQDNGGKLNSPLFFRPPFAFLCKYLTAAVAGKKMPEGGRKQLWADGTWLEK